MELNHNLAIEWSRDYLATRHKITLVIKYLNSIKSQPPSIEVTNDSIHLLMEALKTSSDMYIDLNELPIKNLELRAQNHVLKVENDRLRKEIEKLLK